MIPNHNGLHHRIRFAMTEKLNSKSVDIDYTRASGVVFHW